MIVYRWEKDGYGPYCDIQLGYYVWERGLELPGWNLDPLNPGVGRCVFTQKGFEAFVENKEAKRSWRMIAQQFQFKLYMLEVERVFEQEEYQGYIFREEVIDKIDITRIYLQEK